jgi:hypothetical protein
MIESFFAWMEVSALGAFVKDKAATFATIEAVHLMALAVLGGSVLLSDLRLCNVLLTDIPSKSVTDNAHKFFKVALAVLLVTGVVMLTGVAVKCYHNFYFWVKMIALAVGIVFTLAVRQPLLRGDHAQIQPLTLKLVALASMSIWFLVAASGRWIGFSG